MGPMTSEATSSLGFWIRTLFIGRRPQWTAVRIAIVITVSVVLFKYVVVLRKIESTSMAPALQDGTIRVIYRLAYRGAHTPQRGDIVSVRTSGETVTYVKRVIGLPGEIISIRHGVVHIDGQPLDEPYVRYPRQPWERPPVQLQPDEYYLIGDNRSMPQDRHEFGRVEGRRILGKVVW